MPGKRWHCVWRMMPMIGPGNLDTGARSNSKWRGNRPGLCMTSQLEKICGELRRLVGTENVLTAQEDLIAYSFDGTAALQQLPGGVVLVKSTAEVAGVL